MSSFKDSQEAAYRRLMRNAVRKGGFSKAERDTVLAVLNHWFHYKSKGKMHPGQARIAQKAGVSVRTVATVFSLLRDTGVLLPASKINRGRGKATEYRLDDMSLLHLCGHDVADIVAAMAPQKHAKLHGKETPKSMQPLHCVYKYVTDEETLAKSDNIIAFPKRAEAS